MPKNIFINIRCRLHTGEKLFVEVASRLTLFPNPKGPTPPPLIPTRSRTIMGENPEHRAGIE